MIVRKIATAKETAYELATKTFKEIIYARKTKVNKKLTHLL